MKLASLTAFDPDPRIPADARDLRRPSITRRELILGVGGVAVALAGCSTPEPGPVTGASTGGGAAPMVFGSMIWNASIPFYSNFIKGQQEQADALGVTLHVLDGKGSLEAQVAAMEELITQQVDAILVTPSDPKGIAPIVNRATGAGIAVFAVNNRVDASAQTVTFIGADDVVFGRKQATLLAQTVESRGKVAYLMGEIGTSAQLLRKQGFEEELAAVSQVTVIDSQTSSWDSAKALTVVQNWLTKYPVGELDAIVGQGPEAANAAKHVRDTGRTDVAFILGDYPVEVRDGIIDGSIVGTVNQDPKPQGERAVEAAWQWLTGEQSKVLRPNEYLALPIVTKDNVDQYPAAWGN